MEGAEEGPVPASEGEPGHWSRDADVDPNHAGVEMPFKLPGGVTASRKNGGAIPKIALIADGDGFIKISGSDNGKHRAENFFFPYPHLRLHFVDDARTEQKAFGFEVAATVERHGGAFA